MKYIAAHWFSNAKECIGIVVGENEMGERKAYISSVTGLDYSEDVDYVLKHGAKLSIHILKDVVKRLENNDEQE